MDGLKKAKKVAARIGALRSRHSALDRDIEEELSRPAPDDIRLKALKRMRLKTKDEIQAALGVLRTIGRPAMRAFGRG